MRLFRTSAHRPSLSVSLSLEWILLIFRITVSWSFRSRCARPAEQVQQLSLPSVPTYANTLKPPTTPQSSRTRCADLRIAPIELRSSVRSCREHYCCTNTVPHIDPLLLPHHAPHRVCCGDDIPPSTFPYCVSLRWGGAHPSPS